MAAAAAGAEEKGIKDLWTEVLEAYQAGKLDELTGRKQEGNDEAKESDREPNVVFLGARESGKTSLLNSYIFKDKADTPKPTGSLDYKYTRSDKEVSHFWELGGGRALVSQVDIALNPKRLESTLVVLVLDLSRPYTVYPDLVYWLDVLRKRSKVCITKLSELTKEAGLGDRLKAAANARFGAQHPDLEGGLLEELFPMPVLVVASKWDALSSKDPELLKTMALTLRAVCHANGVSLLYTSNQDKATLNTFRTRVARHVQNKEGAMPKEFERTKPICVQAGVDSFKDIGLPSGFPPKKNPADTWGLAFSKLFPKPENLDEDDEKDLPALKLSPEPVVDQALALKSDDLKRITRKMELARKMLEAESSGQYA